jgi:hypothetical protein
MSSDLRHRQVKVWHDLGWAPQTPQPPWGESKLHGWAGGLQSSWTAITVQQRSHPLQVRDGSAIANAADGRAFPLRRVTT